MTKSAMILAAGLGERFGSITQTTPKPMLKVNGLTLIEHAILRLRRAGITRIVVNVSWLGTQIIEHLNNLNFDSAELFISDERQQILGTGGGVKKALDFLADDEFWLINSDVLTDYRIDVNFSLQVGSLGHLILVNNPQHHPDGDFGLRSGRIIRCDDVQPFTFSGISLLSPKLFSDITSEVFPLEPLLMEYGVKGRLTGELFVGAWHDVGTIERLEAAEQMNWP